MAKLKTQFLQWVIVSGVSMVLCSPAATLYVSSSGTNPVPPFADWSAAATNIQDAVDAATNGDLVLVTNGVYATGGRVVYGLLTNRVVINKAVTVQGLNGPSVTIIQGNASIGDSAIRCAYLTNNAALIGFTLTGGATRSAGDSNTEESGAGVFCESTNSAISNCVININAAYGSAGGVFQGTLSSCTLSGNSAAVGGGANLSVLTNCTLTGNSTTHGYSDGGGANQSTLFNCVLDHNSAQFAGGVKNCTLTDCILSNNTATSGPGAAWASTLNNCSLINNSARNSGGGTYGGVLNNCVLSGNSAVLGGGADFSTLNGCTLTGNSATDGGGAYGGSLNNCILVGNTGYSEGGAADDSSLFNCTVVGNHGQYGGGVYRSSVKNCIIYYNTSTFGDPNCYIYDPLYDTPDHCCTTTNGTVCITNEPLFVNFVGGDYHLQSTSPCINSGNNAYVSATNDLDVNARIVGGTVDIGAYEYQTPVSGISYAWLQQYNLPITTNIDTADLDGTGFTVYQDWIAGLNPTNPASVLMMFPPVAATNGVGVTVSWQSVNTRKYYLQRAVNLAAQPAFSSIRSNLVGQAGTTSYTDTTVTNGGTYFYRIGVQ